MQPAYEDYEDGEVVTIAELPRCDFCEREADYDAKTWHGPWANMCLDHWAGMAKFDTLGTGKGQRLFLVRDI